VRLGTTDVILRDTEAARIHVQNDLLTSQ
jgi:Fe2+ transport system protein FeoA